MKQTFFKTLLIALLPILWSGCSNDDKDDPGGSNDGFNISVDVPNNEISGKAGSFFLKIETSNEWTVSSTEDWCTFYKSSGKGTTSIIGSVQANTTGNQRFTLITVTSGKDVREITLTQKVDNGDTPDPGTPGAYAGRIEIPKLLGGDMNVFVTHTTTENSKEVITFSYEYDCTKLHSRWVAFTFSTATPDNSVGRDDNFKPDPKLPSAYRLDDRAYSGSGYSRGHLVASGDRQYSKAANAQTFYMSNMSPQIQNGFNGGIWASLEGKVQGWGKISNTKDTLYVAKGGTLKEDQILKYISDGKHRIAVPKYYFMAILSLKAGTYKAIGFWFEHKAYSNNNFAANAVSIDELEEKTGIDFFPNLDDKIENEVERSFNKSDWGL